MKVILNFVIQSNVTLTKNKIPTYLHDKKGNTQKTKLRTNLRASDKLVEDVNHSLWFVKIDITLTHISVVGL